MTEVSMDHGEEGLQLSEATKQSKVFGIGLSKTGTNSLNNALRRLGYRTRHYPHPDNVLGLSRGFDALTDSPVIPYYKELSRVYPDSKFILTVRDIEDWLESCKRHWARLPVKEQPDRAVRNRIHVFGISDFDIAVFEHVYLLHIEDVKWYFTWMRERLLTMNICAGDGYEKLCPFLGVDIIDEPFPHANVAPGRET